ncbi:hypothetical protein ACF1AL_01315 [Streptomyces sp. NPDC014801]|uniref:hypothetical protein n=1 Tax=Streptomyces sp. NPDC014801 TaxID=3364916 RepID=UPI0037032639
MRGLSVRSAASTALCATLALGLAAPAALAADASPEGTRAASRAPAPDADTLLDLGALLKPVTDLLDSVLASGAGQLDTDEAANVNDVVQDALADVQASLPAASTSVPASNSTVTTTPSTPATPTTPAVSTPEAAATPAAGTTDAALAALQKAIDDLVKATTSLNTTQAGTAASGLATSLVDLVNATLKGVGVSTSSGLTTATTLPAPLPATGPSTLPAPLTPAVVAPSAS